MRMKPKMIGLFIAVGVVPLALTGWLSVRAADSALMKKSFDQLEGLREVKVERIVSYFQTVHDQIEIMAQDRMIIEAMRKFSEEFRTFRDENHIDETRTDQMRNELKTYYTGEFAEKYASVNGGAGPNAEGVLAKLDADSIALQYYYIRANKLPLGKKQGLDRADDASRWSATHAQIHPIIRDFVSTFRFYDFFLVDAERGDIVYSNYKELDFGTSLIDGPYAGSNIAAAFRGAIALDGPGAVMVDYERYFPSYEAPASFIAAPIFDGGGKIGVLMIQVSLDRLNAIMGERTGLGETGETYLVGPDNLMRSDSYLDPGGHSVVASFANPEKGKVDTESSRAALAGQSGSRITDAYNGNSVLSSYGPVEVIGLNWALLAEIDLEEVRRPMRALVTEVLIISGLIAAVVCVIAYWVTSRVTGPIAALVDMSRRLARGEFGARTQITRRDELGLLAESLNEAAAALESSTTTIDRLEDEVRLRNEAEGALRESEARLRLAMDAAGLDTWRMDIAEGKIYSTYSQDHLRDVRNIEEVLGQVDPRDRKRIQQAIRTAIKEADDYSFEFRTTGGDGQERWVLIKGKIFRDENGRAVSSTGIDMDITHLKETEEALRDREARLGAFIAESTDMIIYTEFRPPIPRSLSSEQKADWYFERGFLVDCNDAFVRFVGAENRSAILGLPMNRFVQPSGADVLRPFIKAVFDSNVQVDKVEHLLLDGEARERVMRSSAMLLEQEGLILGSWSIHTDVTHQKRAERELRDSEEQYRMLFENSHDAFNTIGPPTWRFTSVNAAMVTMFRARDKSQITSMDPWAVSPEFQPDGRRSDERAKEMIETAMRDGVHFFEWTHKRFDGEEFPCTVLLTKLEIRGVPLLQTTVRDVSESRRAELAIRESEERLHLALDASQMGIFDWDLAHNRILWPRRTEEIFGFGPGEFSGTYEGFEQRMHPDDLPHVNAEVARCIETKERFTWEYRIVLPGGAIRWVFAVGQFIFDDKGQPTRMLGVVVDISERKEAEERLARYRDHLEVLVEERTKELRETQEALVDKERLATLGQLTATVSHELRNPLGTIRGSVYVIAERIKDKGLGVERALERIERNIARCDNIIEELLTFTRSREFDMRPTRLDAYLKEFAEEYQFPEGIEAKFEYGANDTQVRMDAERMRQCLVNVLDNARDALGESDEGRPRRIEVSSRANDGRAEIRVRDTGPGIPEELREKVFEPLFSTKGFGVGLGLPLVQQFMERHGGGIRVEESSPNGTVILLWLPAIEVDSAMLTPAENAVGDSSK